ncbi:MAG: hypothetical protein GXY77_18365 [Fibrobacter sp.]|nr:hypothetical protein [Fibrobacter sp.]
MIRVKVKLIRIAVKMMASEVSDMACAVGMMPPAVKNVPVGEIGKGPEVLGYDLSSLILPPAVNIPGI